MRKNILKSILVLLVFSLLLTLVSYSALALYKVIGYAYGSTSGIDATKLTHINYAFAPIVNGQVADPGGLSTYTALRSQNPNLKIILSVGGWGAEGFCDAAATDASRTTFANSCLTVINNNNLDGIDLDWEYPVNGGWGMIKCSPADKQNFTLLLQAIRNKIGTGKLLTIASGASQEYANNVEFSKINGIVDFINMMTYDFGASRHNANLYESSLFGSTGISGDLATTIHINSGVSASKINMGVPFYGRAGSAWPAYSDLVASYINKNGYTRYWDSAAQTSYLNGTGFVTYDDPETFNYKCSYIKSRALGGVMFWQAAHDPSGTLLSTLWNNLNGGAATPTATKTPTPIVTPTTTPNITPGTGNLARGKTVTASSVESGTSFTANLAVDGSTTTRWASDFVDASWIYVDLGLSYNVNQVKLNWEAAYGRSYKIQVSTNATSWTDVYSTTTGDGGIDDITFTATSARYVRMQGVTRATQWGYSLWEFEVYAAAGGATPTATKTPTPTPGVTPTATKTPTSTITPTPSSGGAQPWAPNTAYATGALVTYGGHTYQCRQAHTSLVGWEPPNVPALWLLVN